MVYAFAFAFMSLCGYCYKLVQIRSLEARSRRRDQLVQRRLIAVVGRRPHRYTQVLQRGCSSVGRAQQSHC